VLQISQEMGELAKKARDGKLSPAEMSGATFTISQPGRHWWAVLHAHHQCA
jgi:pyruvate dehydrogenase E2 component (dihydrolipoamide acetyltransferase)